MILYQYDEEPTLVAKRLLDKGFITPDLLDIQEIIKGACKYCWDATTPCHCTNDE